MTVYIHRMTTTKMSSDLTTSSNEGPILMFKYQSICLTSDYCSYIRLLVKGSGQIDNQIWMHHEASQRC